MSINMHQLGPDEVFTPEYHSVCGYQLSWQDTGDPTMVFFIPPSLCPIDPVWDAIAVRANDFRTSALAKYSYLEGVRPYDWIQAIIRDIQQDVVAYMDEMQWADFIKDYIREHLLRPRLLQYLISMGDIVVTP